MSQLFANTAVPYRKDSGQCVIRQSIFNPKRLAVYIVCMATEAELHCWFRSIIFGSVVLCVAKFRKKTQMYLETPSPKQGLTRTLIGWGGGVYSYIHVLPDEFLFKSNSNFLIWKEIFWAKHEYINISPYPRKLCVVFLVYVRLLKAHVAIAKCCKQMSSGKSFPSKDLVMRVLECILPIVNYLAFVITILNAI